MSWFYLRDQPKRHLRKGIWLRVRPLPQPVWDKILPYLPGKLLPLATRKCLIDWIKISELLPNGKVRLEVWSSSFWSNIRHCKGHPKIYQVFSVVVDEDLDWICEGDLGRGLVGSN